MPQRIIINDPVAEALGRLSDQVIGQAVSSLNRLRAEEKSDARYEEQKAYRDEQRLAQDSIREMQLITSMLGEASTDYEYGDVAKRLEAINTKNNPMVETLRAIQLKSIAAKRMSMKLTEREQGDLYDTINELSKTVDPIDRETGRLRGGSNAVGLTLEQAEKEIQNLSYTLAVKEKKFGAGMNKLLQSQFGELKARTRVQELLNNLDTEFDTPDVQYGASYQVEDANGEMKTVVPIDREIANIALESVTASLTMDDYGSAANTLEGLAQYVSQSKGIISKLQTQANAAAGKEATKFAIEEIRGRFDSLNTLSNQLSVENKQAGAIFGKQANIELSQENFSAIRSQVARQGANILAHPNVAFDFSKIEEARDRNSATAYTGTGKPAKKVKAYDAALAQYKRTKSTSDAIELFDTIHELSKLPGYANAIQESIGFDKNFFNFGTKTEQGVARTFFQQLVETYGKAKDFTPTMEAEDGTSRKMSTADIFRSVLKSSKNN